MRHWRVKLRKFIYFALGLFILGLGVYSCTPLAIVGAAAGGGMAGYEAAVHGYRISITKPVKGQKKKVIVDNSTEK